jgi:hypothetical protein
MYCDLNLLLAGIKISTVAKSYGLEVKPRGLSRCVFHADKTPSMSVEPAGRYGADLFRCFGCGISGDVVGFFARIAGIDRRKAVKELLRGYQPQVHYVRPEGLPEAFKAPSKVISDLDQGSPSELAQLASLRGISIQALELALARGLLRFGHYARERSWVVTDDDRYAIQHRPLRRGLWFGRTKAMSAKGSTTRVPLGLSRVGQSERVHIVEGGPDLMAVHQVILGATGCASESEVALGFLGAAVELEDEVVAALTGKDVIIWAHSDHVGIDSANRKQGQLRSVCSSVTTVMPAEIISSAKDLNDLLVAPGGCEALYVIGGGRHV